MQVFSLYKTAWRECVLVLEFGYTNDNQGFRACRMLSSNSVRAAENFIAA